MTKNKENKRNAGNKNGKATIAEVENRIQKVLELYLLGLKGPAIHEYFIKTLNIKVTLPTVNGYITRARKLIGDYSKFKMEQEVGKSILRLEKLFLKSYQIQDYKTCLAVQKELNNLLGLIVTKHDFTSDGKPLQVPQTVFQILKVNPKIEKKELKRTK